MRGMFTRKRDRKRTMTKHLETLDREQPNRTSVGLFGSSDSGKSTLLKRILLLKNQGDFDVPPEEVRKSLTRNLLEGTHLVLERLQDMDYVPEDDLEYEDAAERVEALRSAQEENQYVNTVTQTDGLETEICCFDDDSVDALKYLWSMSRFHTALVQAQQLGQVSVSGNYAVAMDRLVEQYPVWGGRGWKLEPRDLLAERKRTSGIVPREIEHKSRLFEVTDVGGAKNERRKWKHIFNDLSSFVFCVATGDYDEPLFENYETNRLFDSLELFATLTANPELQDCDILLVFTKIDIFVDKFSKRKVPLNTSGLFPDAPTNTEDVQGALQYMEQLFLAKVRESKRVKVHFLDSTDRDDSPFVKLLDDLAASAPSKPKTRQPVMPI